MENLKLLSLIKQRIIVSILADDELGDRLVLKGGNLIQFAYQLSIRASKDIDISIDGEFDDTLVLSDKVNRCLTKSFEQMQMVVIDFKLQEVPAVISDDLKSIWGGYKCEFKLLTMDKYDLCGGDIDSARRHAIDGGNTTKFKIDFSRHELCDEKEEFEINGYTIFGYSPRMFIAEKLRAICQQMPEYSALVHRSHGGHSRSRDFFDVHLIANHYGIDFSSMQFQSIVGRTFDKKRVPVAWIARIKDFYGLHEPDFVSVRDTVDPNFPIADFNFYFDFLCNQCLKLEPLWNE